MKHVLAGKPVPFNPVRATELQQELAQECGKANWREAMANAMARWKAEGGKIEKITSQNGPRAPYERRAGNLPTFKW